MEKAPAVHQPQALLSTWAPTAPLAQKLQAAVVRQQGQNWPHGQKRPKDPP